MNTDTDDFDPTNLSDLELPLLWLAFCVAIIGSELEGVA